MDADEEEVGESLPRKQNFKNLDLVVNEKNYDELPQQRRFQTTVKTKDKKFHIKYTTNKSVKHAPGPRLAAKHARTPLEAFSLFINHEMLNIIVENINTVIETFLAGKQDMIDDSDKYSFYKKVDLINMKAFLGLLYLRARLKLNMLDCETIWHHETANNLFEATMPLNRFIYISRFIIFDEKSTGEERWGYDKFACV